MKKNCGYLFMLVFLLFLTKPVHADDLIHGVTPTQGKASGTIEGVSCYEPYSQKSYIRSYAVTVDFWNVGELGGDQYKTLTMHLLGIGDNLDCFLGGINLTSSFEGGPNGSVAGNGDLWQMKMVDGTGFTLTFEGHQAFLPLENPNIFDGWTDDDLEVMPTDAPADSCSPQERGLTPLKPGDVISPGVTYYDSEGKETGIIQDRWFLNGINTTSIIWDGNPVNVELQYTCLDHVGYSKTFLIPAYEEHSAVSPDDKLPLDNSRPVITSITPVGIAVVLGVIIGFFGTAGIVINKIIKSDSKSPSPQMADLPPQTPPITSALPNFPIQVTQPPALTPSGNQIPLTHNISPAEKATLQNIKGEMQTEVERLKIKWRQTRDAVDKLNKLKKKNMIKFIIKKAMETNEWIMDSPVELINKFTIDPLMEKTMGKHDTSQDGNIIVSINNRIVNLKGEMQQMLDEVRYLQKEISKINRKLN